MKILEWLFGRKTPVAYQHREPAPVVVLGEASRKPVEPPVSSVPALREVVFDCETTGFGSAKGHRIVALSFVEVTDRRLTGAKLDFLVNPGRPIPADATAIHGITNADVKKAPSFAAMVPRLTQFIAGAPLVGFNIGFDLDFLVAELERAGIDPGSAIPVAFGYDVLRSFSQKFGCKRNLFDACRMAGVDLAGLTAHRAADDTIATARLHLALLASGVEPVMVELEAYRTREHAENRIYDDDDLQAAFDLFQAKEYETALERALGVVEREKLRKNPSERAWNLASQILVRMKRHEEDRDLLTSYFDTMKLGITPSEIDSLAARALFGEPQAVMAQRLVSAGKRGAAVKASPDELREMTRDRLRKALDGLPFPAAYRDAATALRKLSANTADRTLLEELHGLAQEHAFLLGTAHLGWDHPLNKPDYEIGLTVSCIIEIATAEDRAAVRGSYSEVGYKHLPLLNKTDVKRLVAAFGEPRAHLNPRDLHRDIWERYRLDAKKLIASLGLDRLGFRPPYNP
jgi:DNA polymerase-3 subunit epsilon